MYTTEQKALALQLLSTSLSNREVALRSGVSRGTVRNWRMGGRSMEDRYGDRPPALERPIDHAAYSYLLGLYLGDGSIAQTRTGFAFIRWGLDRAYPGIARECERAVHEATEARCSVYDRPDGGVIIIQSSGQLWLNLFPQHGPGKKHLRPIWLAPWQREIATRRPQELIRGLIHSDGSRCINRFSVKLLSGRIGRYAYPRYFFTNLSADIRGIFCEYCELLGIRWTQSNARNISVSHRDSVAILDSFVGPKT